MSLPKFFKWPTRALYRVDEASLLLCWVMGCGGVGFMAFGLSQWCRVPPDTGYLKKVLSRTQPTPTTAQVRSSEAEPVIPRPAILNRG